VGEISRLRANLQDLLPLAAAEPSEIRIPIVHVDAHGIDFSSNIQARQDIAYKLKRR